MMMYCMDHRDRILAESAHGTLQREPSPDADILHVSLPRDVELLGSAFDALDTNHDGVIDR